MDEFSAALAARKFTSGLDLSSVAVSLDVYLNKLGATVRFEDMGPNESGYTVKKTSGPRIVVNSNETPARQRFTICHEIAHVVLQLPSSHVEFPSWAFVKRDENEAACDVFAAELLMPYAAFKSSTAGLEVSWQSLQTVADTFGTSLPATASRFASLSGEGCAFVLCERGRVRYSIRSNSLRSANARIDRNGPIPPGSVSQRIRAMGESGMDSGTVEQDVWFTDWDQNSELVELAKHFRRLDQTVALLWCETEDLGLRVGARSNKPEGREEDDYAELTGDLQWRKGRR